MNKLKVLFRILATCILLVVFSSVIFSCSDDDESEVENTFIMPMMEFEQDTIYISGEAQIVTVKAEVTEVGIAPEESNSYPWITNVKKVFTRMSIDDYEHHTDIYEIQVTANDTPKERKGVVVFSGGQGTFHRSFYLTIIQTPLSKA